MLPRASETLPLATQPPPKLSAQLSQPLSRMRGRLERQLRAGGAAQRQANADGDGAGQSAGHGSEGGGDISAASARVVVMSLEAWEQPLLTEVYSLASLCLLRPGKQQRAKKSRAVRDT